MRKRLEAAWAAIVAADIAEEAGVYTGMALVCAGFWMTWRPGAFFFAGAVMLWLYLPERMPFVHTKPSDDPGAKRKS